MVTIANDRLFLITGMPDCELGDPVVLE